MCIPIYIVIYQWEAKQLNPNIILNKNTLDNAKEETEEYTNLPGASKKCERNHHLPSVDAHADKPRGYKTKQLLKRRNKTN